MANDNRFAKERSIAFVCVHYVRTVQVQQTDHALPVQQIAHHQRTCEHFGIAAAAEFGAGFVVVAAVFFCCCIRDVPRRQPSSPHRLFFCCSTPVFLLHALRSAHTGCAPTQPSELTSGRARARMCNESANARPKRQNVALLRGVRRLTILGSG